MAAGGQTVGRLVAVLVGFGSASTLVLLLSGLLSRGANIGGATLSLMGLSLGAVGGLGIGPWLVRLLVQAADRRLPLLLALVFLPLALLPAQPQEFALWRSGFSGWLPVLAGVAAALPLGFATGVSWSLLAQEPLRGPGGNLRWAVIGVGLGLLVGSGAALMLSMFRGTFLVILFAAPMVWPVLPRQGPRSLLLRMLLTWMVLCATMLLLFL